MNDEVKIGGDISYTVSREESMMEFNSLILALKTKLWLYKSEILKKKDIGGQVEIKQ